MPPALRASLAWALLSSVAPIAHDEVTLPAAVRATVCNDYSLGATMALKWEIPL